MRYELGAVGPQPHAIDVASLQELLAQEELSPDVRSVLTEVVYERTPQTEAEEAAVTAQAAKPAEAAKVAATNGAIAKAKSDQAAKRMSTGVKVAIGVGIVAGVLWAMK